MHNKQDKLGIQKMPDLIKKSKTFLISKILQKNIKHNIYNFKTNLYLAKQVRAFLIILIQKIIMTCTATNKNVIRFIFKLGFKQNDVIL